MFLGVADGRWAQIFNDGICPVPFDWGHASWDKVLLSNSDDLVGYCTLYQDTRYRRVLLFSVYAKIFYLQLSKHAIPFVYILINDTSTW